MTKIRLYNTATRTKAPLEPLDPTNLRMYVCGPTVYDRAHLGNGRPVVVFDTLFRLLRHVYGADHVTYVRNFTDVDDKINATAQARKAAGDPRPLEALIRERTEETISWYHADMDALGALRPTHEPRATEFIGKKIEGSDRYDGMIGMIEGLIERKNENGESFAYEREGHVLFRVRAYKSYGALSGRSVDDMIAGARVEVAPFKEDPMDFVLWKPSDDDLPGWDSPWGRGRPGWHIECSAMSHELLGAAFDIHGGGLDLQFPHHENEIAQSACMGHGFARVWMHNEMLQVEGKKMSKSLGNFFTVRDLLDQGVPGEVIRYVYLMTHYRKPMDWTEARRIEATKTLHEWAGIEASYGYLFDGTDHGATGEPPSEVVLALSDDLNTSLALTHLRTIGKTIESRDLTSNEMYDQFAPAAKSFLAGLRLLGIDLKGFMNSNEFMSAESRLEMGAAYDIAHLKGFSERLSQLRVAAQKNKDFAAVDALKATLTAAGVEVRMSKAGVQLILGPDFDPAKLEALK